MDETRAETRSFGQLISVPSNRLSSLTDVSDQKVRRADFVWTPSREIIPYLPAEFEIHFACLGIPGMRRLRPVVSASSFCVAAARAGQAILDHMGRLSPGLRANFNMMTLLFQLGPRLRERLQASSLGTAEELNVSGALALELFPDILPDDFGIENGSRERWSVRRLLEEGRQAARNAGITNPTENECIVSGVDYEATIHPVELAGVSVEKIRTLLRYALFDSGSSDMPIDAAIKDRVYGRLVDAMQRHLDEPSAEFNRWFFDNLDGIVHQISKRKLPDGPIQREVVRQTILEIVFDSWSYMGRSVSTFMRSVSSAMNPPLSSDEQVAFDVLYRRSPYLGDLPLILFHEQFPTISPAVLAIWDSPDASRAWGRLQRVLQTYATMVSRRREVNRFKKRRRGRRHSLTPDVEPMVSRDGLTEFQAIARELLELVGMKCDCETGSEWAAHLVERTDASSEIVLDIMCGRCNVSRTLRVPRSQFEQVARRVRGLEK